jgi:hypothetical protein
VNAQTRTTDFVNAHTDELRVVLGSVLLQHSIRRGGPHVLVVVEDDGASLMDTLISSVDDVETWVTAGHRAASHALVNHISLHADDTTTYDPDAVAMAIDRELGALAPVIDGKRLGVVFSEAESTLIDAADTIVDVEYDWSQLVSDAAWSAGAHPAWNLCVYELDAIKQMADPLRMSLELIRTHDTVWTAADRAVRRNGAGSRRLLQQLRPPDTRADHWREICEKQLARISTNRTRNPE